ncbi:hypothetical protein OESDEN_17141, partial [Oesophagostomum dentatum]
LCLFLFFIERKSLKIVILVRISADFFSEPPRPPALSPLSINTRRTSDGAPLPPRPSPSTPRTGFMPRLHDISPSTASTPSKSPLVSPAPRRVQTTSMDGLQRYSNAQNNIRVFFTEGLFRSPAEIIPPLNRGSRGSFSEYGRTSSVGGPISPALRNGSSHPPPQMQTSPAAPLTSPKSLTSRAQISPSDAAQRDEPHYGLSKPQDMRKARFADNPVSEVTPPAASTTPPLMPSPAQALRSPDLPPVFNSSSTTATPSANTAPPRIPMKQALAQLGQIVKELNEVNAL